MQGSESAICPECGVGFSPETILCPSCEVRLVFPGYPSGDLGVPLDSLVELRSAGTTWIRRLQEELARARIFSRTVVSRSGDKGLSVHVRPADLARAKEIDRKVYETEVPEGREMPRVEALDTSSCPACGHALAETDRECAECGLLFASATEWRCGACDGVVAERVKRCPHCGAITSWNEA